MKKSKEKTIEKIVQAYMHITELVDNYTSRENASQLLISKLDQISHELKDSIVEEHLKK